MDLDDLLPQVGEFGRYQKLLLWLVCLPACLPCGFCAFNQLFMADTPPHWCRTPDLQRLLPNASYEYRRALTIPLLESSNSTFKNCVRYAVNWTALLAETPFSDLEVNISWPTESCTDGWEYDTSEVTSSIVIDFDLVCSRDIYPTIGLAALNTGGPVGVYLFGVLNDRMGRRLSFFLCLGTLIFGSVLTAAAPEFWSWAVSRVIVGLTIPAIYQIPFIIWGACLLFSTGACWTKLPVICDCDDMLVLHPGPHLPGRSHISYSQLGRISTRYFTTIPPLLHILVVFT